MHMDIKLNPLAEGATFDLYAENKIVNLVALNDFLEAYEGFDVHRGNFGLFAEDIIQGIG